MAIHVRLRASQKEIIRRRSVQMRLAAFLAALSLLLLVGVVLYLRAIYFMNDGEPRFISYVNNENEVEIPELPKDVDLSSESGSAAAAAMLPDIIVATSDAVAIESSNFPSLDLGNTTVAMGTVGMGLVPQSLGTGRGMGTGGTGRGSGTGNSPGSGSGKKHGQGSNDDIQVVIALDASGSMNRLFEEVSKSLEYLMTALNSCKINGKTVKVNLGIVAYGQAANDGKPWVVSHFSRNISAMSKTLSEVPCDGSIECCGEAIAFALEEFPWNRRDRDNILKVIFIAGNEPFDQGDVDYRSAIDDAQSSGVIINTIHCGPDVEDDWREAAALGGGEAFAIDISESEEKPTEAEIRTAIADLWNMEVVPCGSPADRERADKEFKDRPKLPSGKGTDRWIAKNRSLLFNGFDWDAVELCRRIGNDFELEMVGGLANLPDSLRAGGQDAALERIRTLAARRQQCLTRMREALNRGGFSAAALHALRIQAADKGIDMEF